MLLFGPKIDVISKKKKKKKSLLQNLNGFFGRNQVISQKKRSSPKFQRFLRPKSSDLQNGFSGRHQVTSKRNNAVHMRLRWTSQCHLDGPPLDLMGPLKFISPGVIVPP